MTFRVIEGGRAPDSTATWSDPGRKPSDDCPDARLRKRTRRAEQDATKIAELVTPAMALLFKPDAEVARMVAASGFHDCIATRNAFGRGRAAAHELSELLEAAERKLVQIIGAMAMQAIDARDSREPND
jgi:hypothetical protein